MLGLRKIREDNDLTQTEMATILGISVQRYNSYENKKRRLPIEIAKQVSHRFNVTLEKIYSECELNKEVS